jgi:hypothetical protein
MGTAPSAAFPIKTQRDHTLAKIFKGQKQQSPAVQGFARIQGPVVRPARCVNQ